MNLRPARPARVSAVALVVLASMAAVSSRPDAATVALQDDRVVVAHRESRFSPVWPQPVAASTTLVSRRDKGKQIRVESSRGGRVWTASDLADHDVPQAALTAYKNAAHRMSLDDPGCQLPWTLLAAIGRVESNHGRFAGSVLSTDGVARPAIIGVALNGVGPVAAISDSDGGELDGDTKWDRAVGPMQFIPTTWAWAGRDGDGNGVQNPHDMDDAALAAGDYLCGGASVATAAGMKAAIFRYNPSDDYVRLVRAFERGYSTGVFEVPSPAPANDSDKSDGSKDRKKSHKKDGKSSGADRDKKGTKKDNGDDGKSGKAGKGGASSPSPSPKPKPKPSSPSPAPQPGQPAPQQPSQPSPNQPAPGTSQDPTPSSPSPSNPSPSDPAPSPTPSQPAPREVTGALGECAGGWCLGDATLDFGSVTLQSTPADLDGDGAAETLQQELTDLAASNPVTMTVTGDGPLLVLKINGVPLG